MENSEKSFSTIPLTCLLSVTKIHSLFYYEFPKDFTFKGESHDFWELVYVDKGECISRRENQQHALKVGEALLIPPNEYHALLGNGRSLFNVFIISFTCKSKAMDAIPNDRIEVTAAMRETISKIIKESRHAFYLPVIEPSTPEIIPREDPLLGSRQLVKLYLEELLISILRKEYTQKNTMPVLSFLSTKNADPKSLIEAVERYLLDNLDKPLSISTICETFHYSKNYIYSHFKQNTGYTIMEYFSRAKIERAKDLIREHNYSLSAISEMLGFSSPGYFSKTFKRITGLSPLEYQRSLRFLLG